MTAEFQPEVAGQVDLPPEVREPLYEGLVNVPVSGTASRAFAGFPLDRYPIAGKTGTAQVDGKSDTAVFAAFGPAPAPEYAVAVVMESGFGGHGGGAGRPGDVRGAVGHDAAAAGRARRGPGGRRATAGRGRGLL